ncbi:hypothetical protein AAVH_33734 [Aphelenchoides avenae]|nr:hypothetical protein AAVH_33734 [Aphelenchus avenae]
MRRHQKTHLARALRKADVFDDFTETDSMHSECGARCKDYTPGAGISEMAQCSVCTQPTSWNHYGTVTCNSCASFFRRTVSNGLSYACTCRMPYRRKKKEVRTLHLLQRTTDTLLSLTLSCRNRLYVARGLQLRRIDATSYREPGSICLSEFRVLKEFCCDFIQHSGFFKPQVSPALMSSHFFAVWMTLEQLLATVQNGPFEPTICFQDYSTTIPVIYEAKLSYFRSMPWILDADALAKQAMEYNLEALRLAQTVRRAALDDNETVALLLLIVAHYGTC